MQNTMGEKKQLRGRPIVEANWSDAQKKIMHRNQNLYIV